MGGRAGVLGALAIAGCALLACDGDSSAMDADVAGRDGAADGSGDRPPVVDGPDAPVLARLLDLVFVIDNSSGTREEQELLGAAFPAFLESLRSGPGGMPDLHIAIVSTNFGSGPSVPSPECVPLGDRGRFQVRPGCGLDTTVGGYFLTVDGQGKTNFTGSLPQVFSCMALLGTGGCGYEHQLQSLRGAIATPPVNVENRGFVRADARLGIVILSDEDDCSGEPDSEIYGQPIPGQAGSVRCALLGHVCNGQPVPAMAGFEAPLSSCAPYARNASERRSRLINVQEFVDYVMAIKFGRPDDVVVSTIIGWNEAPNARYAIVERPASSGAGSEIDIAPACSAPETGNAGPGVRLQAFARSFSHHTVHSICGGDLKPAMREIGRKMARLAN